MKRFFVFLTLLVSVSALIFSGSKIIGWLDDSKKTNEEIKSIQKSIQIMEISDNNKTELVNQAATTSIGDPYWDYVKMNLINADISKLREANSDTVGWIRVNGTNINYPFVQTKNNSYYLYHSFNKSFNYAGWVFLDYRNNINDLDRNTIIYAHGRTDKTMFGSLSNTLSNKWLNDSSNHVIRLSTDSENSLWQVFSVYNIPTTNDYITTGFSDDDSFLKFINLITKRSIYDFNAKPNVGDKILTLSTCLNNTDKIVVHAKLIKKEKK